MGDREGIVAVGLLTERDLRVLGEGFRRAYRLDDSHDFDELLAAIDRAEQEYWERNGSPEQPAPLSQSAASGGNERTLSN